MKDRPIAQSITTARPPLQQEQSVRMRKYLISMGLRVVCFLGAAVTTGWVRWTLVVAAVFLPIFAVVIANAVKPRALNVATNRQPVSPSRHLGK